MNQNKKPQALYVHVPFCRSICYYCDFCHRFYQEKEADAWLQALRKEILYFSPGPDLRTVYIGGGTPTALSDAQLDSLLCLLDPYTKNVREYTIEINPETLDENKAAILAEHGINRASIGLQTADEELLKKIGRHHTAAGVAEAVRLLKDHGIDNISLDLMYSLPDQNMASLRESIRFALSLQPKHLSLYSLTVEENTVFGRKGITPLDEDTEADMYEEICRILPQAGYRQYEISNFALPGYESQHNLVYWHYEDFYGLSAGASGMEDHCRYDKPSNLSEYLNDPLKRDVIPLTRKDEMFETVMMGLRLKDGIFLQDFQNRFGMSFSQAFGAPAEKLLDEGKLQITDGKLKCADAYYHLLNSVLSDLLPV